MNTNVYISIFFVIIEILIVIRNLSLKRYSDFVWFCDFAPLLIAIGFFIDNTQFVKALINVGFLSQIVALGTIVPARVSKWRRKNTLKNNFYIFTDIIMHVTIIIAIILTIKSPPQRESLKYAFWVLIPVFIFSYLISTKKENINVIYSVNIIKNKGKEGKIKLPYQTALWIVYAFIIALITYYAQYLLYNI